jgi:hypothetical protein
MGRAVRNSELKKKREGWVTRPVRTSQGFTQTHPLLVHLRTNPGMQRIAELPAEGRDGVRELWAFGA